LQGIQGEPGLDGADGDQTVYVQATAPLNPQVGWVWIQTA
jgi:hypothetical protein